MVDVGATLSTLPLGARNIIGYRSWASCALVRLRQVLVAAWYTWGSVFTPDVVSIWPETTNASPLASVVTVGYQRPAFMSGAAVQELVAVSYRLAFGRPTRSCTCPPARKMRWSARYAWPTQKMS